MSGVASTSLMLEPQHLPPNYKLQPTMRHSAVSRYHWFSGRMSAEFNVGPSYFLSRKHRFIANEPRGAQYKSRGGLLAHAAHKLSEILHQNSFRALAVR